MTRIEIYSLRSLRATVTPFQSSRCSILPHSPVPLATWSKSIFQSFSPFFPQAAGECGKDESKHDKEPRKSWCFLLWHPHFTSVVGVALPKSILTDVKHNKLTDGIGMGERGKRSVWSLRGSDTRRPLCCCCPGTVRFQSASKRKSSSRGGNFHSGKENNESGNVLGLLPAVCCWLSCALQSSWACDSLGHCILLQPFCFSL